MSPLIRVRGRLAIAHFGKPAHEPVEVEISIGDEEIPVVELHFSTETTWRLELSQDAGAALAGMLARKSGVLFEVIR